ncbi:MAG: helix-turn-helix domain-containing protein [Tistlia sp.]|uniref:MmyB family transcriptional regulator n=1 Tax=Tistlia sp. TaxID=3057121 RepID=UPI0034A231F1
MIPTAASVGPLLRQWRRRRRLSQLELAAEAEVSQRHLSFLESGRAAPSREMVLRLAEPLDLPLRERNALLVAAGFAPLYPERALDHPRLAAARRAVELLLAGQEPHPALAVDRHWTLVSANRALAPLLAGVPEDLLEPPVNVLRLSLHPRGLAARIRNFRDWRGHLLARLQAQVDNSADAVLMALVEELKGYPVPAGALPAQPGAAAALGGIAVPLELDSAGGRLSFLSTTTVFGTAMDVALSELAIESFFPADPETAAAMRRLAEG